MSERAEKDSAAEQEKYDKHLEAMRRAERERHKVHAEWKARWDKGQRYSVRETVDREGDILWVVQGPSVGFASHSIDSVQAFLKREGVEYRTVRFEPHVWAGMPLPHDGSA